MDLYFEEVVQVDDEFVDQPLLFVLMMKYDENIHQEFVEVTKVTMVYIDISFRSSIEFDNK